MIGHQYSQENFMVRAADIAPVDPLVSVGDVPPESVVWLLYDLGNDLHFNLYPTDKDTGRILPFEGKPFPSATFSNLKEDGVYVHEHGVTLKPGDKPYVLYLAGQVFTITSNESQKMTIGKKPSVMQTEKQDKILYSFSD